MLQGEIGASALVGTSQYYGYFAYQYEPQIRASKSSDDLTGCLVWGFLSVVNTSIVSLLLLGLDALVRCFGGNELIPDFSAPVE
jgi:hypothetical protein